MCFEEREVIREGEPQHAHGVFDANDVFESYFQAGMCVLGGDCEKLSWRLYSRCS